MVEEPNDISIRVDQDEFDLLKNNVDFGKTTDVLELLDVNVLSNFETAKSFVTEYVESNSTELLPLYYELVLGYLEELFFDRGKIVDLLFLIFNSDPNLKNARISDFLILCNSFPITNIRSLIQDCRFPKELLISNLGTALLTKLSVFTAHDYKISLEKNGLKYENYVLNNEDSLGYSILVVQMYSAFNDDFAEFKIGYYSDMLLKLIGFYKLDPYRVFDIIFDVFANNFIRNYNFAMSFLKKTPFWPIGEEHISNDYGDIFGNLNKGGNQRAMEIIAMKLLLQNSKPLSQTSRVLIGCLIKEGFINLGHLFSFLRPFEDSDMALIEKQYDESLLQKELSASELAMAAPLDDSDDESSNKKKSKSSSDAKSAAQSKQAPVDPKLNFKLSILNACLTVGLYNESIFLLAQYPYLVKCDDIVAAAANRLMEALIDDLYRATLPLPPVEMSSLSKQRLLASSKSSSTQETVISKEYPVTHLLTFDVSTQSYSSKKFHFFFDWKAGIPSVENLDDLFKVSNELLSFIGSRVVKSPTLFEKLCRVVLKFDAEDDKRLQYYRKFIFPFIPFIENNATLVQLSFSILKKYDFEVRYNLYGEFYQSMYIKNQDVIQAQYRKIEKETGRSLKRLTLQTAKSVSRHLSKLTMSSPMIVIIKILESLESYDNLTDLIVEHLAPFFNEFAWDVLPMAILMRLTKPGRSAVQDDGLNERQWLQSLSAFIGKVARNPMMDLKPILIYCLKKLNNGEINDSIVLKDLLSLMSGIKPITNLTLEQIELLSSEKELRKIGFNILQDERFSSIKPATRLLNELIKTESLNEFFILLSSLSSNYIRNTNTSSNHLKILTQKHDEFESTLHLFADLINEFLHYSEFVEILLPVDELSSVYNVPPQWSFEIWRKRLSQMIDKNITGDTDAQLVEEWNPVLLQIMEPIQNSLPNYDWENLNIGFFVTFWQLSLYDINFSEKFYEDKLTGLKNTVKALSTKLKVSSKDRDVSSAELKRLEGEISRNQAIVSNMPSGKSKHSKHFQNVMLRLNNEKKLWLSKDKDLNAQLENFLDHCLLPRSIHSPFDAIFCAKFVFFWHKINDEDANVTTTILDYLMNKDVLNSLILTFTSAQAENFGLFYGELLRQLNSWRLEENFNLIGMKGTTFESYRQGLFKIHQNILNNLRLSLKDPSYITRSNCLVFLKNLLDMFPLVDEHCESLLNSIEEILAEDDREDLKLASNSLIGRIKSYASRWVPADQFYQMTEEQLAEYKDRRAIRKRKLEIAERQRRAKIAAEEEIARKRKAEIAAEKAAEAAKAAKAKSETMSSGDPYAKLRPTAPSSTSSSKSIPKADPPKPAESASKTEKPKAEATVSKSNTPKGPKSTPKAPAANENTEPRSESKQEKLASTEDRSKLLKARIEAEKAKSASTPTGPNSTNSEGKRPQARFADVMPRDSRDRNNNNSSRTSGSYRDRDSRSSRDPRSSAEDQREKDRSSRYNAPVRTDDSSRKRKHADDPEEPSSTPEKKSKTTPVKPPAEPSRFASNAPLPPPSDPAPPVGPASLQKSDSSSSFDPKKRTRLPPVVPRANSSSGKNPAGEDDHNRGRRQGSHRRGYRR